MLVDQEILRLQVPVHEAAVSMHEVESLQDLEAKKFDLGFRERDSHPQPMVDEMSKAAVHVLENQENGVVLAFSSLESHYLGVLQNLESTDFRQIRHGMTVWLQLFDRHILTGEVVDRLVHPPETTFTNLLDDMVSIHGTKSEEDCALILVLMISKRT